MGRRSSAPLVPGIVTVLLLGGCASNPTIPIVAQVPAATVTPIARDIPSRVLILDRVVIDVPKGTAVGEKRRGALCAFPEAALWPHADPLVFRT